MFAKDRDRTKPSPTRPLAPKLAGTSAFVRSPPAAPRLAAPFSSSPSNGSGRPNSFSAGNLPSSPSSATSASTSAPSKPSGRPQNEGTPNGVNGANVTPRTAARTSKLSSTTSTPRSSTARPDIKPRSPNVSSRQPPTVLAAISSPASLKTKSSPATPTGRNGSKDLGPTQRPTVAARSQISPTPLRQAPSSADIGKSFFHASDAPPQSPPRRPVLPKQSSSFVYANGQRNVSQEQPPSEVASVQENTVQNAPTNNTTQSYTQIGTTSPPFKLNSSPPLAFHRPTSSSSAPVSMQVYNSIPPKPISPPKQDFHLSYRKGASQVIRPPESRTQLTDSSLSDLRMRQASLDTVSESFDQIPDSGRVRATSVSSQSLSGVPIASPAAHEPATETSNPQTSLAAKARQERKVLDLEISNSSLLAINRSLEREVRRQKIEIRRYRRLSRNSTRISWLSDATTPDLLDEDTILEESDENSPSDMGFDDVTDLESMAEEALSPLALAQSDEKHLRSDQKRLQIDLSKHKQLLVDSQKMNGSLKRCLGLSEQLIKDAGKALEYKVDVTDVQLGGRVLSPEEVETESENHGPDHYFYSKWRSENERLSAASQRLIADWDVGTDQDSGVDLESGRQSREPPERDRALVLAHSEAASQAA